MIEFYEFELLFINVEKDRYEEEEVKKLFFSSADLIVPISEEKALSQEKFMELALEMNLFSKDKIIAFASNLFQDVKINLIHSPLTKILFNFASIGQCKEIR